MKLQTKEQLLKQIEEAFSYHFRYHGTLFIGKPAEMDLGIYREYMEKYITQMNLTDKIYIWELVNPFEYGMHYFKLSDFEVWVNILERLKLEDFSQEAKTCFEKVITEIKKLFEFEKIKFIFDEKQKVYKLANVGLSIFT